MKPLWDSFNSGELAESWEEVVMASFQGEDFSQRKLHSKRIQSAVHLGDWSEGELLDAATFRNRWNEYLNSFGEIIEFEEHLELYDLPWPDIWDRLVAASEATLQSPTSSLPEVRRTDRLIDALGSRFRRFPKEWADYLKRDFRADTPNLPTCSSFPKS